jgi:amino acid adenylation domain-containing protein
LEGVRDRPAGAWGLRPGLLHATAGGVPLTVERSISEAFAEQAERRAEDAAIAGTGWQPSFAELDSASNRLARAITERADGPPERVALLLRHDAPQIAAALAVLKAGGTAVVLHTGYPPARLDRIRAEVEPRLVIADHDHRGLALEAGFSATELVEVPDRPEASGDSGPTVTAAPDDPAFIIYTSGSTGRPKGVVQTHRNILHNALRRHGTGLGLRPDDRIVLLAPVSGGQGLATLWTTLLSGATLCPFPAMERGVTGLPAWLAEHGVTVLMAPASLFRHFVRTLDGRRLEGIRLVRLGSEAVFTADLDACREHFAQGCVFANTYSSSETGNITRHLLRDSDDPEPGGLPVGKPVEGIELLLLDDGEIAVRSDYLSPGYWRDEALTRQRFGRGLFRTGDLGRIDDDGMLTWLGRKDSQVKVRGNRVDLLEVESALSSRPAVAAAAVRPRPTPLGDTALTAYVALRPGTAPDSASLRAELRTDLPDPAVPSAFAYLEALPLNAHGKVDGEALARLRPEQMDRPAPAAPTVTETEELVAGIWASALEREPVGPRDDFFELEGDSLTAAEIAAEVHVMFGVELELGAFAENPTVAAMAALVDRLRADRNASIIPALTRAPRGEPLRCSLIQERTWRECQTPERSQGYAVAKGVRIVGPLDVAALRRGVNRIVARHESLRTTFAERDGEPLQVVHPPGPVELPLIEVGSAAEADKLMLREARRPFDLERGPLLRLLMVRLGEEEHRLLRFNHHIISDARSWEVFFEELVALYEADRRGEPPPLPAEEPLQYADFAAWERRALRPGSRRWREDVEWWRSNLDGAPPQTPLPFVRRQPDEGAEAADGVILLTLPPSVSAELDSLGREQGATRFMLRLAVFAALLAAMSENPDLVVGTYTTTRQPVETRDMFGFFANPVALRVRPEGNPSFADWLAEVRASVIEMSAHAQIPYEALRDELRGAGVTPPAPCAMFGVTALAETVRFGGLEMTPIKRTFGQMPWRLSVFHERNSDGERLGAAFDATAHHPRAVRTFLERYQRLLRRIPADLDRPLGELVPNRSRRFGPLLRRRLAPRTPSRVG